MVENHSGEVVLSLIELPAREGVSCVVRGKGMSCGIVPTGVLGGHGVLTAWLDYYSSSS